MQDVTPKNDQIFRIPLSENRRLVIIFESLPVTDKDIEKIKKWLELFSDNLIRPPEWFKTGQFETDLLLNNDDAEDHFRKGEEMAIKHGCPELYEDVDFRHCDDEGVGPPSCDKDPALCWAKHLRYGQGQTSYKCKEKMDND